MERRYFFQSLVHLFVTCLVSVFGKSLTELEPYLIGGGRAVITTLILLLIVYLLQRGFRAAVRRLGTLTETADGVHIQKAVLLSPNRMRQAIVLILRIVRLVIFLALFYTTSRLCSVFSL